MHTTIIKENACRGIFSHGSLSSLLKGLETLLDYHAPPQLTLPVTYDFSKKKNQFFKINLPSQIAFSVTFSYIHFYVYLVYVFTCVGAYRYMSSHGGPRLMLCSFSISPYLIYWGRVSPETQGSSFEIAWLACLPNNSPPLPPTDCHWGVQSHPDFMWVLGIQPLIPSEPFLQSLHVSLFYLLPLATVLGKKGFSWKFVKG